MAIDCSLKRITEIYLQLYHSNRWEVQAPTQCYTVQCCPGVPNDWNVTIWSGALRRVTLYQPSRTMTGNVLSCFHLHFSALQYTAVLFSPLNCNVLHLNVQPYRHGICYGYIDIIRLKKKFRWGKIFL